MKIGKLFLIAISLLVAILITEKIMKNKSQEDIHTMIDDSVMRIETIDVESRTEFQKNLYSLWSLGGFIKVNGLACFYGTLGESETKELIAAVRYFGVDERVAVDLEKGWAIRPKSKDFEYFEEPSLEFDDIETRIFKDFKHLENIVYDKYIEHEVEL